MNVKDKTILVTGASQGIGLALSKQLARDGARLILIARSEIHLKKFVEEYGSQHRYYVCDLSQSDGVLDVIQKIKKNIELLDVLVNVAGIGVYKHIEDIAFSDWQDSFALNITAPFLLAQGLLPLLKKTNDSFVLNIGSGMGTIPTGGRSVYCATKFAMRGWSLSLSEEFKKKHPSFCLITLGSTITNFGDMTIEEKEKARASGRAYFSLAWVTNKLIEIIHNDGREDEITLFPGDYGFGTWKKPSKNI